MWRQEFERALIAYLKDYGYPIPESSKAIFDAIMGLDHKYGIWEYVGRYLGIKGIRAHNYYHNTWYKQFYGNLYPFKAELAMKIEDYISYGKDKTAAIASVASEFVSRHEGDFHGPSLRYYLHYVYRTYAKKEVLPYEDPQLIEMLRKIIYNEV